MPEFVTELYYGRVVVTAVTADMRETEDFAARLRELLPDKKKYAIRAQWVHYRNGEEDIEQSKTV